MNVYPVARVIPELEKELNVFWGASDAEGSHAISKVRAATMNLVVLTSPEALDQARRMTQEVEEIYPGRAFLIWTDNSLSGDDVRTAVDGVCRIDSGNRVCYDRLELGLSANASPRAKSILEALLLPEAPVVVELAPGGSVNLALQLSSLWSRVVVDSMVVDVKTIAQIARTSVRPIADRAFVRNYSWRELVARFFDQAVSMTQAIRSVEIQCTRGGLSNVAAMMLGWLASRLGWRFESKVLARDFRGKGIALSVDEVEFPMLGDGELVSVKIDAVFDGEPVELGCVRQHIPGRSSLSADRASRPSEACKAEWTPSSVVRWTRTGPGEESHVYPLGYRNEVWVLSKAIDATESDVVYRESVLQAAEWASK